MISNLELLYSTTKLLRENFKDYLILIDSNNEDIKTYNTFYVEVKELLNTSYFRFIERTVNIYINFIPLSSDEIKEQILTVQSVLNDLFDINLEVSKRKLMIDSKSFTTDEELLTMNITLKFLDDKSNNHIPEMDQYSQLMNELNLTLNERND